VTPPPPRPTFYCYAVVNVNAPPTDEPLFYEKTRQEARKKIQWREDADQLRIRRARVSLFTS
jgi:hypothetical protein